MVNHPLNALTAMLRVDVPEWGEAFHALGGALAMQQNLEEACEAERTAIRLLPSDPRPLISLGWNLRLLGKYAEAVSFFEEGLKLKPHYAEADARFMLAEVYEQFGQIENAAALWRQIIYMKSSFPVALPICRSHTKQRAAFAY